MKTLSSMKNYNNNFFLNPEVAHKNIKIFTRVKKRLQKPLRSKTQTLIFNTGSGEVFA